MIISRNSKKKVYHMDYCPYAKRISTKYRKTISEQAAKSKGYSACAWCGGLHGEYLLATREPEMYGERQRKVVKLSYDTKRKAMCFRTKIAFWKIVKSKNNDYYLLFHLNENSYNPSFSDKKLSEGQFHRQTDVPAFSNLDKIHGVVTYIYEHDKAKRIIENDWKKLPKKTKRQKKYYEQAKRKDRHQKLKRIDELFKELERRK